MTAERHIRSRAVLTGAGWTGPARIRIDGDGSIVAVEPLADTSGLAGPVIPGMPNLHSHAFQRQMAGLAEHGSGRADSFWTWREAMYGLANRVDPDQFEAIAAWVQAEMLEAGFTSCGEFHYLHHQPDGTPYEQPAEMSLRLLAAAADSGIALTVLPVLYGRSGFSADDVEERQRRFRFAPERYLGLVRDCRRAVEDQPLHRVGIAPHSLRAVSAAALRAVIGDPETAGGPVHIHVAEQLAEVDDCLAATGARPVEWLTSNCDVDDRWCLVHATHLTPAERSTAARTGAVAGLCPTTEADLGDGVFDTAAWLAGGGALGVGSDSNLRVSVTEELRALEFQARLRDRRRIVLAGDGHSTGRTLFEVAARGGARALGQPVGVISTGRRADLVELDDAHPFIRGRCGDTVLDSWIFAGGRDMVRSVWVGGQLRVVEGRHLERPRLQRRFVRVMGELL